MNPARYNDPPPYQSYSPPRHLNPTALLLALLYHKHGNKLSNLASLLRPLLALLDLSPSPEWLSGMTGAGGALMLYSVTHVEVMGMCALCQRAMRTMHANENVDKILFHVLLCLALSLTLMQAPEQTRTAASR